MEVLEPYCDVPWPILIGFISTILFRFVSINKLLVFIFKTRKTTIKNHASRQGPPPPLHRRREGQVQVEETRAVSQLILHGRQVPRLL